MKRANDKSFAEETLRRICFVAQKIVLPDADAVFGGEVKFVGGFDVEGVVPTVFVADCESAIFAGCVGIGKDLLAQGSGTGDIAPVLSEGDEELLIAGEVIDFGSFAALE